VTRGFDNDNRLHIRGTGFFCDRNNLLKTSEPTRQTRNRTCGLTITSAEVLSVHPSDIHPFTPTVDAAFLPLQPGSTVGALVFRRIGDSDVRLVLEAFAGPSVASVILKDVQISSELSLCMACRTGNASRLRNNAREAIALHCFT
jgi:hypothetical protein